ncbi:MAG: FadR family transcriptional regulator [Chloroflexi bacterium]|nr:FadR family transcriptional regulator [Chloroflexota bacterium]
MSAPAYKTIRAERLYEQIVSQIELRITNGDLKVGDQLPTERDLGVQFGVSRTAVREAIKSLSEKGLVDVQPGRGTFITNGTSRAVRHSLDLAMKFGGREAVRQLVEVREIFEPEIAALAAVRAQAEHIAALNDAVAAMDAALSDSDTFIEADLDFHLTLAEATDNPLILNLIDPIVDLLREQRSQIFRVNGGAQRGQSHHKRILDAVTRHDPVAARAAMQDHLRQVRQDSGASDPVV